LQIAGWRGLRGELVFVDEALACVVSWAMTAFVDLGFVIELRRLPKATRRGTKAFRVLLFIDGDFGLNVHRVSPGASFLIGAATKRRTAADTRAGRKDPPACFGVIRRRGKCYASALWN
jgi:hypothetical protein